MPNIARERFMVAQTDDSDVLSDLAAKLGADPEVELVDYIGPANKPNTLIVEMPPDRARKLQQNYAGKLIVEKDKPLTAY